MITDHFIKTLVLEPYNLSQRQAAYALKIPQSSFNEILKGKRRITPDLAIRLSLAFGQKPIFWLWLQYKQEIHDLYEEGKNFKYARVIKVCDLGLKDAIDKGMSLER